MITFYTYYEQAPTAAASVADMTAVAMQIEYGRSRRRGRLVPREEIETDAPSLSDRSRLDAVMLQS